MVGSSLSWHSALEGTVGSLHGTFVDKNLGPTVPVAQGVAAKVMQNKNNARKKDLSKISRFPLHSALCITQHAKVCVSVCVQNRALTKIACLLLFDVSAAPRPKLHPLLNQMYRTSGYLYNGLPSSNLHCNGCLYSTVSTAALTVHTSESERYLK